MAFETYQPTFTRGHYERTDTPAVTINNRGTLIFNAAAKKTLLDGIHSVIIQYDPDKKKMRLKITDDATDPAARHVTRHKSYVHLKAKAALSHWNILPTKTCRSTLEKKGNYLIFDIQE